MKTTKTLEIIDGGLGDPELGFSQIQEEALPFELTLYSCNVA
jgi:hypothetical protein